MHPILHNEIQSAHRDLWQWCRARDFAGHDPFDGLNSRLFQASPFKSSRTARLAWTQLFKRSPIDLRPLARVPRERNAKGIALFTLAALADYRRRPTKEAEVEARDLLDDLVGMTLKGFGGAAWGYNFDWQGRAFFAPRGTPTIVPTAFAARALVEASVSLNSDEHLKLARSTCDFILNDLNRSEDAKDEVCFSYSPVDRTRVFNASLLGAEVLASVGKLTGEESLCDVAMRAARYVIRRQRPDGSWSYGADDYQSWADNFHTAFILTSLSRIVRALSAGAADRHNPLSVNGEGTGGEALPRRETPPQPLPTRGEGHEREVVLEFESGLVRGYESWTERFFLSDGWPKYYPDRLYPADVHSTAAAIVALVELHKRIPRALDLAETIAHWALENLRDPRGFFYYQRRRFHTVRTPYMRWSEAWMTYALARLSEGKSKKEKGKS